MTTKQQERDALAKITKIIADLGEQSYIGTAFDGCFDLAEQNIEYDAAFSMKYYEEELKITKGENARLLEQVENEKEHNAQLLEQLNHEQEWKPYESDINVKQSDYEQLVKSVPNGAYFMSDDEAIDWICGEFDFDRSKITILRDIDEEEINRHRQCRKTGRKIDRRPVYCATDYYYIRFNTSRNYYEIWDNTLRPFYC
jgi:hypothetical protein